MKFMKENKLFVIACLVLLGLFVISPDRGMKASMSALDNIKTVGMILPPIFILIGLMDVWVPKETMVKYMGKGSGFKGGFLAVLLGAVGAGPLVVAFPIAALLIRKGAKLAYVFLFLGAWTSVKLPIFMFELANFGAKFTLIHVVSSLSIYLVAALIMDKLLVGDSKKDIEERAEKYA